MKPATENNERPSSSPAQSRLLRSVAGSFKAIGWAFLGLRAGRGQQQDVARVSPLLWIGSAIAAVLAFVLGLIVLVRWLVPMAGQAGS